MNVWADAIDQRTGQQVKLFVGAGMVANIAGDLFGTTPQRIIRSGKAVIGRDRLESALRAGWRVVEKAWPDAPLTMDLVGAEECDPYFAWIERTEEERDQRDIA